MPDKTGGLLQRLRTSPWKTSLLVLLLYAAWFLAPGIPLLFSPGEDAGVPPTEVRQESNEIAYLIAQAPNQIGLVILLTTITAVLVWWTPAGLRRPAKKRLRFSVPPLLFCLFFLAIGFILNFSHDNGILGEQSSRDLAIVVVVSLMIGYSEELMFRGLLFHGATARFGAFAGVLVSSLLFGVFHFLNLLAGAGFGWTVGQVAHAASDGFMYGGLRLITGSIWPAIVLHGLWDLSVSSAHAGLQAAGGELAAALSEVQTGGVSIKPIQFLPGLIYGSFLLWRWRVLTRRQERPGSP